MIGVVDVSKISTTVVAPKRCWDGIAHPDKEQLPGPPGGTMLHASLTNTRECAEVARIVVGVCCAQETHSNAFSSFPTSEAEATVLVVCPLFVYLAIRLWRRLLYTLYFSLRIQVVPGCVSQKVAARR